MRRTHGKLLVGSLGALVPLITAATVVFACTNYVGLLQVWGDNTGGCSGTAPSGSCTGTSGEIVTGNDTWNAAGAMTQTVGNPTTKATHGTGSFYVEAEVSGSNSLNQSCSEVPANCHSIWYDVNTIPIGYPTSRLTWGGDPSYDCMSWNMNQHGVVNRGSVQINTSGLIIAAKTGSLGAGTTVTLFSSSAGIAGPFSTSGEAANTTNPAAESGVCLSDATSNNGNQAPLLLV